MVINDKQRCAPASLLPRQAFVALCRARLQVKLKVGTSNGIRGALASRNIREREIIASIPAHIVPALGTTDQPMEVCFRHV